MPDDEQVCGAPTKSGGRCQIPTPAESNACHMHPNEFDCPECGQSHEGWPESCDECGAVFAWDEAAASYYGDGD